MFTIAYIFAVQVSKSLVVPGMKEGTTPDTSSEEIDSEDDDSAEEDEEDEED